MSGIRRSANSFSPREEYRRAWTFLIRGLRRIHYVVNDPGVYSGAGDAQEGAGGDRGVRGPLSVEDHLRAAHVLNVKHGEAQPLDLLAQLSPRVRVDVLRGVALREDPLVQAFQGPPDPPAVVGRTQDQCSPGRQHPDHVSQIDRIPRDVLDDLRADHRVEGALGKRELHERGLHELPARGPKPPELADLHVQAHRLWKALNDSARAASDVKDAGGSVDHAPDHPEPGPLPVALQRDPRIEGA